MLVHPGEHRTRGVLGAIVRDDELGLAAPGNQARELARVRAVGDKGP